jgi:hypothetical protein
MELKSKGIFCQMCSTVKHDSIPADEFIGWSCPECSNIICKHCLTSMQDVGAPVICMWWSCVAEKKKQVMIKEIIPSGKLLTGMDYQCYAEHHEHGRFELIVGACNIFSDRHVKIVHERGGRTRPINWGTYEIKATLKLYITDNFEYFFSDDSDWRYTVYCEKRELFSGIISSVDYDIKTNEPASIILKLIAI